MSMATPGIPLGYLAAASIMAALWLGWGLILLPLVGLLAILHILAARQHVLPQPAGHHYWLARHHIWTFIGLGILLMMPPATGPQLLTAGQTIFNTLLQAPHPLQTLAAAHPELSNWPNLIHNGLIILWIWFCLLLWLSIRLLRRGLRWAEKRNPDTL